MAKTAVKDKVIFKPLHICGGDIKMIGLAGKGGRVGLRAVCQKCGAEARKIKDLAVTMFLEKK